MLQTAVEAHAERLAAAAADQLVSISVSLPATARAADRAFGGDTHWIKPREGGALHAVGVAAEFGGDMAVERFRRACGPWRVWGDTAQVPLAFFTLPPATQPAVPRLWIPRVLARRRGAALDITFSAWRGGLAPRALIGAWLDEARRLLEPVAANAGSSEIIALNSAPDPLAWQARVAATRQAIDAGRFVKAVLARRLSVRLSHPVDCTALIRRLAHDYPECHIVALPHASGEVVAATPEQLALKRGGMLVSHALAGTARRHGSATVDAQAAAALMASPKERQEHALVVETIAARMAEICTSVEHAPTPSILPLRFVQHLWTQIGGHPRDGIDLLAAVTRLHPTPAVLGMPGTAASAWLAELGECRDSLYTGVVGWMDMQGDGDAVVVLRAAYIEASNAVLWAGAGIMAGSDPVAELAETELKFATMLEALNVKSTPVSI